jgi:ABC-type phosphate/phosphonate transport system substrate-binding protein
MYDFPEVRAAVNRLWDDIRCRLDRRGIAVPRTLARGLPLPDLLAMDSLLLAQCCGAHVVRDPRLRVLGAANHAVPGCGAGRYHSSIVARTEDLGRWRTDPARALADAVLAVNEPASHSGSTALLHWLAEQWAQAGRAFPARITGAHRASLAALRDGAADLAAIDSVSLALIERHAPAEVDGLSILGRGATAPALPYVTGAATLASTILGLRQTLGAVLADPATATLREALLIDGFHCCEREDYAPITAMERRVAAAGLTRVAASHDGARGATA